MGLFKKEKKVLIIDDEPELVKSMTRFVTKLTDHSILTATNGREALEVVLQESDNIYFILSDIRMPEMNGIEFANRLKELNISIPLFFITGNIDQYEEDIKSILCKGVLKKPYSYKNFQKFIKDFLV